MYSFIPITIFNLVSFVLTIICRTFSKKNKFSKKQKNINYYNEMDDDVNRYMYSVKNKKNLI